MFFPSSSFETSLVDNLGYDGFKRLRHAFDIATGGDVEKFDVVVDAGCGTGLVGEQVRSAIIHFSLDKDPYEFYI